MNDIPGRRSPLRRLPRWSWVGWSGFSPASGWGAETPRQEGGRVGEFEGLRRARVAAAPVVVCPLSPHGEDPLPPQDTRYTLHTPSPPSL